MGKTIDDSPDLNRIGPIGRAARIHPADFKVLCMIFADFSPPSTPSLDQQRDALQKGLGRAMQWALAGRLEDDPLLEACLREGRYDTQCEPPRGDWLRGIIRAIGAVDRFRGPILHALHELSDERSAGQLCELARHYAEEGDDAFRMRLREIVEQTPIADDPQLGNDEVIELDGEQGFVFVARARGGTLADREWDWNDGFLVDQAIERFGAGRVDELLGNAKDGGLGSFREAWSRQKDAEAEQEPCQSHRERMRAIPVGMILSAARSNNAEFGRFRGWGWHADEADLDTIVQNLRDTEEPAVIAGLLYVFSKRASPRFADRFLELAQHSDDEVRRRAIVALEQISLPSVREFALAELRREVRGEFVVGLFTKNFQPGDEQRILETLTLPDDDWDRHSLLMDVIDVLEANPESDCSQLGIIVYASTPCEMCRSRSVRLLHQRDVAPAWLTAECQFDSSEESRRLVAEDERT